MAVSTVDVLATHRRVIVGLGVATAVIASYDLAQGDYLYAALVGAILALGISTYLTKITPDALIAGLVAVGYLVGNRGFAQIHPPLFPLLPGEAALALGLSLVLWRAAIAHRFPIRRDLLNAAVIAWMATGLARIGLDLREYGVMALRDFAIVYYAFFFFLGQYWAGEPRNRWWLLKCLAAGLALCAPVFYIFDRNQDWFDTHLIIGGAPLIFVKSDVAGGFMAGGALWFVRRFVVTRQKWTLLASAVALAGVFVSNSRAAVVALFAGLVWLVVLRAGRMLRVFGVFLGVGMLAIVIHAIATPRPFYTTPLYRLYESVASMTDFKGTRSYQVAELSDKPDNNQFRLVWWRTVVDQTWDEGRWFGLGFGHDLGAEFFRVYYADSSEEFNVRSPHNFLLSIFGRMGIVGSLTFAGFIAAFAAKTWRARSTLMHADSPMPLWLCAWTILVSACFGVVLEGPMAAMVFWTTLGMANAASKSEEPTVVEPSEPAATTSLPA